MKRRTLATAASIIATALVWEIQRRRDLRAIVADPEWWELHTPIPARTHDAVSADGTRIHVEISGPEGAPTILLIPGWTETISLWHYQIRDLAAEYRVVAYDQRGHGLSGAPGEFGFTDTAIAEDLHAVLAATLPPLQRCVVAGHSMGGMAIVAWAGGHSALVCERLAAAALINTGVHQMLAKLNLFGEWAGQRFHAVVAPPLFGSPRRVPTQLEPISYRAIHRLLLGAAPAPAASRSTMRWS